jgi:hypothetical protein
MSLTSALRRPEYIILLFVQVFCLRPCYSMASLSPRFRTWPITAARSIEPQLQQMGLRIPAWRIDGTTSSSTDNDAGSADKQQEYPLSDALVSVGAAGRGGTGSFVSAQGLILTNWHVAYDAVRQASLASKEGHDYVEEGFVASSRTDELQGPNYEVWITRSIKDVSDAVVDVIASETDPLERANRVRNVIQEIAQKAQEQFGGDAGKRCDVQEMLPNESYVLFTYERLRDVRIVYVPPKSLGNFGGDTDNFEWPRHTADFTLLRAYVGPNGEAAEYSPDNVPYQSKARLNVQKNGAAEGDMVFLLGFPGRTMRYAPTSRLAYSDEVAVPNMVKDFTRKLQLISEYETDSPEAALKLGNSKKGLANEWKRSKGKLVMMRKLGLLAERKAEEDALCEKAPEAAPALERLSEIYGEFRKGEVTASALEACRGIYAGSTLMAAGHALHEYLAIEKAKPDEEREASYRQRNLPFLFKRLGKRLGDVHLPHETALVKDAIGSLSGTSELEELHGTVTAILGESVEAAVSESQLTKLDIESLQALASNDDETASVLRDDPFVKCAAALWDTYKRDRDASKALFSERDALFAQLLELQRKVSGEVIYPDCNGSLRISAGHVEGYQAADAVEHKPSTTLAGLFDKATEARLNTMDASTAEQFECPERLYELLSSSGNDSSIGKVPVCLLYSTDTVGGNSGSPVMNADGELVGINFDRQRQGLMNEYKWSKDYSRSIGVDVRYMLWLIGDYDGAADLVDEMLS